MLCKNKDEMGKRGNFHSEAVITSFHVCGVFGSSEQFRPPLCPPAASPAVLCVPYSAWSFSNMTRITVFLKEGGRESRNVEAGAGPEALEERN